MSSGDVLVVWKLDRLGRSLKNLIDVVTEIDTLGIGFVVSLKILIRQRVEESSLSIFGSLNEFERELFRERTQARLVVARAVSLNDDHKRAITQA